MADTQERAYIAYVERRTKDGTRREYITNLYGSLIHDDHKDVYERMLTFLHGPGVKRVVADSVYCDASGAWVREGTMTITPNKKSRRAAPSPTLTGTTTEQQQEG